LFTTQHSLTDHKKSAKHLRKSKEHPNPFKCMPCSLGFHNKSNLTRYQFSKSHDDKAKVSRAARKAEKEDAARTTEDWPRAQAKENTLRGRPGHGGYGGSATGDPPRLRVHEEDGDLAQTCCS
jgi:hypothetical protein